MLKQFDGFEFETTENSGVVSSKCNNKNAFVETVPDGGPSKSDMVAVFKHSAEYIAGATEDAATRAAKTFKGNKKTTQYVGTYPYGPTGSGSVVVTVDREKTFKVPGTGNSVTKPVIGVKVVHESIRRPSKSKLRKFEDIVKSAI